MEKIDFSESNEVLKPALILLDGSKGAGKTTVGMLLEKQINDSQYLSFDAERKKQTDIKGDRTEQSRIAFESIMSEANALLNSSKNVIVDCGLSPERVSRLELLAKGLDVSIHKFLLKASYNTLLERVRGRDVSKGKDTDVPRFQEVYNIVHDKDFEGFTTIVTEDMSPEEIARQIVESVNN